MRANWEVKKLGEVCDLITRGVSPKYVEENGLCVLNQKCIRDHKVNFGFSRFHDSNVKPVSTAKLISLGDVLVNSTGTGTLGRVAQVRGDLVKATVDSHVTIVRPKKELFYNEFFGYAMIFIEDEIAKNGEGCGGQTELARDTLKNKFEIGYPKSLDEQKCIVAILDEAFEAIATAKVNAEKNLQNARELFDSYLQSVFANPGADWEEKKLREIGVTQTGTTPKSTDKNNYGNFIPFVKPADVDYQGNGAIRYDNQGLSEKGLKNGRLIKKDSILMVCIGASIGKVGFVDRDVSSNQQINSLSPFDEHYPKFVYYALSKAEFYEKVLKNSAQATLPIINKSKWENLSVILPKSHDQQQTIVAKLDALSLETKKLEAIYRQKLADLDELKKSILHKAFSGELTRSHYE